MTCIDRLLPRAANTLLICIVFLMGSLLAPAPALGLDVAVPYVQASAFWNEGYDGTGVEVGVIDLFLADGSHPALASQYLGFENFVNGQAWVGSHGTWVAGTFASQDATHKGVAPGANFWTGQTTNRGSISGTRTQTIAAESFAQGLGSLSGNPVEVLTMSIGFGGTDNGADQWSLGLDHIVRTNERTILVAAGNDGPSGDTISGIPPAAYNVITVGATGDTNGTASQDYSNVADFSSRGPTADGRSKPDIVAPGSLMHLPSPGNGWDDVNGTSFATPMVAGGATLLIDMGQDLGYSTDPKVVKSVLLNSADKLAGWSNTSSRPLDFDQGAGQMNLAQAYEQYLPGETDPGMAPASGWDLDQVSSSTENLYQLDAIIPAGERITATLAWNRTVTTDTEDIEDVIYSLDHFDNLDLFLYDESDLTTPISSSQSTIDNVEHLYVTAPTTGRYVLGVQLTGSSPDGSEEYALAWDLANPLLLGDMNGDSVLNDVDINLFVQALVDRAAYDALNLGVDADLIGDINGSGSLELGDIGGFKLLFPGPGAATGSAVPEPTMCFLLVTWVMCITIVRRPK